MDERAARISLAIEKSGLSYPELEKITGVSKSSLQRYATGGTKKIPIECIEKIAEATGTDARYLMGWDSEPISTAIHMLNPATSTDFQPVNFWGKVSAGVGAYADGVPLRTMYAETDDLQSGYEYAWLEVDGDSMTPDLQDGDYLLVRVQDTAQSGDMVVALVDNGCETDGLVKRIEIEEGNHLALISTNPAYPPRVFIGDRMNDVRIFGVVVSSKRKWR